MRLAALIIPFSLLLGACQEHAPTRWQGYVEAETIYVAAPVAGTLKAVPVQRGQRIDTGSTLFALEPSPENAILAFAVAQAQVAAAELADLEKGKRPEEIQIIKAQYAQAKAANELTAKQLRRTQQLFSSRLTSQEALDEIRAEHTRSTETLEEISAQLATARLAARPDQIEAARAKLQAAQAEVEQARWQVDEKVQPAPHVGIVQDVLYREGEYVSAGKPVVALLPPDHIKIRFFVPQPQLALLQPGALVQAYCDGCGAPVSARVRYISPTAEYTPPVIYSKENRAKFVYLVEAWPEPEAAARLHPGQPMDIELKTSQP